MRTVRVTQTLPGTVYEIEQRWYDTSRWTAWVEGLRRVVEVAGDWPGVGSSVTWDSGPAGRGHVVERVVAHEPLTGQTVEVDDSSITGRQSVAFVPVDDGVEVQLALAYELKKRSLFTPLVDALFIKRAMATSLATTLSRFGAEVGSHRSLTGP
ncbi:MAG: SRPBCC family protein [Solirubrobacteraceae bacterium]